MRYQKIMLAMWTIWSVIPAAAGWAQSYAEAGLVQGAVGGAVVGQIIGRDTRSTLLGSAVGGMLGLIIGNTQDNYRPTASAYRYAEARPSYRPRPAYRDTELVYYEDDRWERHDNYRPVYVERRRVFVPPVMFTYRAQAPGWGRAYPPHEWEGRNERGHGDHHHRAWAGTGVARRGYR